MQALCQLDAQPEAFLEQLDEFLAEEGAPRAVQKYARHLVRDAHGDLARIDGHLQGVLDNWDLKRVSAVERNILRTAVCELLHHAATPEKVVLNEAVEIAKEFGSRESPGFVNGVLDAVIKKRLGAATAIENAESTNQTGVWRNDRGSMTNDEWRMTKE